MTEKYLRSLLEYIESFWNTGDLVIKGSIPHFLSGRTNRSPLDLDILFLGARDYASLAKKWNNFVSHFEIDSIGYEGRSWKIYYLKFNNSTFRVEFNYHDNLPRNFIEIIPGFTKLYSLKYNYWILSKIQSISYYMSNASDQEDRLESIINDLESVSHSDIIKIKKRIPKYLQFALNNLALISFNSFPVNLDKDFLEKEQVFERVSKYLEDKPTATQLINEYLRVISHDVFSQRIEDLNYIFDWKTTINEPGIENKKAWQISNNVISFDSYSTLIKATWEALNHIYTDGVAENFFDDIDLSLLVSESWNFDNIFLPENFDLDLMGDNVKSFARENFIPVKESDYEYETNTVILPVKFENEKYHLLINNFYYLIIFLFIYKDTADAQ